jgi:hypothetical protein
LPELGLHLASFQYFKELLPFGGEGCLFIAKTLKMDGFFKSGLQKYTVFPF